MTQRLYLLVALLNAVHVDTVKEKSVVAIRPKPGSRPIFEVATTREGSGIALINQTPQTQGEPEASESCSWWEGGSLTPNADHSVAAALRELSVCLARLADTLDWADHTSKHNQRTDH